MDITFNTMLGLLTMTSPAELFSYVKQVAI